MQDALEAAWRNRLGKKREEVSKATELRRLVAICIRQSPSKRLAIGCVY